jgi:hypothetical protein
MLRIRNYINNPKLILLGLLKKTARLYPDKFYLKAYYRLEMGSKLNLKEPKTFNEKLQWLKLYDRNPEYIQMVDKIAVKKYVANIIGEEYIIPTLGIWDTFEDIDFDKLPNQFVLKTNHSGGSNGVVICKDKSTLNIEAARRKLNKSLRTNYFYKTREWPYKKIKPCILAEKYLEDESGLELKDYKFFCFNGEPKIIQVDFHRFEDHTRNIYDIDWKLLDLKIKFKNDPNFIINKPLELNKMLEFASILSKNIPHLRVDFYYANGKIFLGELTFYHGSGTENFIPNNWNYKLGCWIEFTQVEKQKKHKNIKTLFQRFV